MVASRPFHVGQVVHKVTLPWYTYSLDMLPLLVSLATLRSVDAGIWAFVCGTSRPRLPFSNLLAHRSWGGSGPAVGRALRPSSPSFADSLHAVWDIGPPHNGLGLNVRCCSTGQVLTSCTGVVSP